MRKNGFTLIELLAVIVILAIIALIATPIILGIINDAREKANERSVELYAAAVKNGIAAYQLREGKEVSVGTYNETNKLPFAVEYDGNVECTSIIISEDNKVSLEGCKVNNGEKTYNYGVEETPSLVGTMGICNPLSDVTEGVYTAGDKYECDVDPNKEGYDYIFYVLNSDSTSVNLIMDSNITRTGEAIKDAEPTDKGQVAWINTGDYIASGGPDLSNDGGMCQEGGFCTRNDKGPITAMNHLQTATTGWTNTNQLTINEFTDKNGGTHSMKEYVVNARMPYYNEISNISTTTLYLIDYLEGDSDDYYEITGRNGVSGADGYWLLSSHHSASIQALYVQFIGHASDINVDYFGNALGGIGVRPVINLSI